jgi:hypothetical protein
MAIVEESSTYWQELPDDDNFATHRWYSQLNLVLGEDLKFNSSEMIVTG